MLTPVTASWVRLRSGLVRILLRHTDTGMYLQGPDRWTEDPEEAHVFPFVSSALEYVETCNLDAVDVAFACGYPVMVMTLSVDKARLEYAPAGHA